jgi:hypothetical protein
MAINTDKKVDFLWKRTIFSRTETDVNKAAPNEFISSAPVVLQSQLWSESDQIPSPAPGATQGVVQFFGQSVAVKCAVDSTVTERRTWITVIDATTSPFLATNRHMDWVPPIIHPSYQIKVYAGDPNAGGKQLNQLTNNEEWVFDYAAGVLHFPNNIPSALATSDVYVIGYKYVGRRGISAGGTGGSGTADGITLGTPTDGSLDQNAAIKNWNSSTKVVDALDDLNELLGKLLPSPPPNLSTLTLVMTGGADAVGSENILLAEGTVDNTGGGSPASGTKIYRIAAATASTTALTGFGSGISGTLAALVNGTESGKVVIDNTDKSGTYGSLIVTADIDYPTDKPGFWRALSAKITSSIPAGLNKFRMSHTDGGATNEVFFVYDDRIDIPSTTALTVAEGTAGTLSYSSSIPHYGAGATLKVGATVSKLAGLTYLSKSNIQIGSVPTIGTQVDIGPGNAGMPAVFTKDLPNQNIFDQVFTIGGSVHTTANVRVRGRNPAGDGQWNTSSLKVNVMTGTPTTGIRETSIAVTNMGTNPTGGNAGRIILGNTDTPAGDVNLITPDWVSSAALQAWDAVVVGGILKHDATDYSTGYLPPGPNLSGRAATQYITFMFRRRAQSGFVIDVTGTYDGLWVKLPGITTKNTLNGWWSAKQLYDGAGVPDVGSNGAGCAMGAVATGSTGQVRVTFGTQSSTNSTNNIILVRFSLTAGKAITGLSFIGV